MNTTCTKNKDKTMAQTEQNNLVNDIKTDIANGWYMLDMIRVEKKRMDVLLLRAEETSEYLKTPPATLASLIVSSKITNGHIQNKIEMFSDKLQNIQSSVAYARNSPGYEYTEKANTFQVDTSDVCKDIKNMKRLLVKINDLLVMEIKAVNAANEKTLAYTQQRDAEGLTKHADHILVEACKNQARKYGPDEVQYILTNADDMKMVQWVLTKILEEMAALALNLENIILEIASPKAGFKVWILQTNKIVERCCGFISQFKAYILHTTSEDNKTISVKGSVQRKVEMLPDTTLLLTACDIDAPQDKLQVICADRLKKLVADINQAIKDTERLKSVRNTYTQDITSFGELIKIHLARTESVAQTANLISTQVLMLCSSNEVKKQLTHVAEVSATLQPRTLDMSADTKGWTTARNINMQQKEKSTPMIHYSSGDSNMNDMITTLLSEAQQEITLLDDVVKQQERVIERSKCEGTKQINSPETQHAIESNIRLLKIEIADAKKLFITLVRGKPKSGLNRNSVMAQLHFTLSDCQQTARNIDAVLENIQFADEHKHSPIKYKNMIKQLQHNVTLHIPIDSLQRNDFTGTEMAIQPSHELPRIKTQRAPAATKHGRPLVPDYIVMSPKMQSLKEKVAKAGNTEKPNSAGSLQEAVPTIHYRTLDSIESTTDNVKLKSSNTLSICMECAAAIQHKVQYKNLSNSETTSESTVLHSSKKYCEMCGTKEWDIVNSRYAAIQRIIKTYMGSDSPYICSHCAIKVLDSLRKSKILNMNIHLVEDEAPSYKCEICHFQGNVKTGIKHEENSYLKPYVSYSAIGPPPSPGGAHKLTHQVIAITLIFVIVATTIAEVGVLSNVLMDPILPTEWQINNEIYSVMAEFAQYPQLMKVAKNENLYFVINVVLVIVYFINSMCLSYASYKGIIKWILMSYGIVVIEVLVVAILAANIYVTYINTSVRIDTAIMETILRGLSVDYTQMGSFTITDLLQTKYQCCGLDSLNDWNDLRAEFNCNTLNNFQYCVPYSCCRNPSTRDISTSDCGKSNTMDQLWPDGCRANVTTAYSRRFEEILLGYIILGCAQLLVAGMSLISDCIRSRIHKVRQEHEEVMREVYYTWVQ